MASSTSSSSTLEQALKDVTAEDYKTALEKFITAEKEPNVLLLDLLVEHFLTDADRQDEYLKLVVLLVRQPSLSSFHWLEEISKRILRQIESAVTTTADVMIENAEGEAQTQQTTRLVPPSPMVLQVWMDQMITFESTVVHSNLSQALFLLLKRVSTTRTTTTTTTTPTVVLESSNFVNTWKTCLEHKSTSVAAVRCAQFFVHYWCWWSSTKHGNDDSDSDVTISKIAKELLLPMLTTQEDPLLQISVLDMLVQQLEEDDNNDSFDSDTAFYAWLAESLPWSSELLHDKDASFAFSSALLLAAHVYQYLTSQTQRFVLEHAIMEEMGVMTTNETNRLLTCQALLTIVTSTGTTPNGIDLLQNNPILRQCWWGNIARLSVPKLQAAILVSFAQLLNKIHDKSTCLKLYAWLGIDNHNSNTGNNNTTEWLYQKFAQSPIPELRIATYTVWTAFIGGNNNNSNNHMMTWYNQIILMTSGSSSSSLPSLLEWMQRRESTHDARTAKFEWIQAMHANKDTIHDKELLKALSRQIELGAHGMEPISWDTMQVE